MSIQIANNVLENVPHMSFAISMKHTVPMSELTYRACDTLARHLKTQGRPLPEWTRMSTRFKGGVCRVLIRDDNDRNIRIIIEITGVESAAVLREHISRRLARPY